MIEIKNSSAWDGINALVLPTTNLTASELKRLNARNDLIDAAVRTFNAPSIWVRVTRGIFKDTIFEIQKSDKSFTYYGREENYHKSMYDALARGSGTPLFAFTKNKDHSKGWDFATRIFRWSIYITIDSSNRPIKFKEGWIFPEFFSSEIVSSLSILVDYTGGPVFCIDTKKRPLTFKDRLKQTVEIGDLVVVALNQGAGLDVCMIRGFSDEDRVVIESVSSGEFDRLTVDPKQTNKIMKMPNSLRDTAMMMKLGRN